MSESTSSEQSRLTRSSTYIALAVAAFISGANLRLFDALLPSIATYFEVDPPSAAITVTAFTLAYGLFQIVHGPLGDRFGKIRIVAFATLCGALSSLGCAFAPSLRALAILRMLTGMSVSAVIPMAIAWIGDQSGYEKRQATLGRFVGFLLLGQVMGPAIGGILAQLFGWREVFYVLAAAFFIIGLVLSFQIRKSVIPGRTQSNGAFSRYWLVVKDRWVRTVLVAAFLEGVLFFGTLAYIGAFLQTRFTLSVTMTGVLTAFYGIGGLLYSLSVRKLLSRLSEAGFVRSAGLILLACFAVLPWIPFWQMAIPVLAGIGFSLYMLHNTLQTKATEMSPAARGTAIAVFAFSLFVGQALGVAASGISIRTAGYPATFTGIGILLVLLSRWFAARMRRLK